MEIMKLLFILWTESRLLVHVATLRNMECNKRI